MCCTRLAENTWCKNSPSPRHRTTLSGCIFATKACIDNRKKNLLNSNISFMSSQYGELRPSSGWDRFVSLGHPRQISAGFASWQRYCTASTGWPKEFGTIIILYAWTLPNISQFSKLFHYQNQEKFVIILLLEIPPHLKCVTTLACEMSNVLKATIENKTTSVTCGAISGVAGFSASSSSKAETYWTFDVKTAGCDSYFRQ